MISTLKIAVVLSLANQNVEIISLQEPLLSNNRSYVLLTQDIKMSSSFLKSE